MLSMFYEEYMGMTQYNQQFLMENPLAPMRQWEMENHGSFSREKDRLRLFARSRVAEFIPGMDWKAFSELTPEQTEWVLEIVQEEAAKKGKAEAGVLAQLQTSTNSLQGLNVSDTKRK